MALGEQAIKIGVAQRTARHTIDLGDGQLVDTVQPEQNNTAARRFEGTLNRNCNPLAFSRLVVWQNNSCAVDALLFVAHYTGAGTTQADALPLAFRTCLTRAQTTFRAVMEAPWAILDIEARMQLRRLIMESFVGDPEIPGAVYEHIGSEVDAAELASYVWPALGGWTFHIVPAKRCCDGMPFTFAGRIQSISTLSFQLTKLDRKLSVGAIVQQFFAETSGREAFCTESGEPRSLEPRCSSPTCLQVHTKYNMVLDHLPPFLFVSLVDGYLNQESTRRYFDQISIGHTIRPSPGTYRRMVTTYEVVAVVLLRDRHYFARALGKEEGGMVYWEGNSGRGGRNADMPRQVGSWTDSLIQSNTKVTAIAYRRRTVRKCPGE